MTETLSATLVVLAAVATGGEARLLVVVGAALAVATVVVTIAGNIPLNNALDAAGSPDEIDDLAGVRNAFEVRWVRLNTVRAVTSTASLGALVWAAGRL